jgi:hypothetical protein
VLVPRGVAFFEPRGVAVWYRGGLRVGAALVHDRSHFATVLSPMCRTSSTWNRGVLSVLLVPHGMLCSSTRNWRHHSCASVPPGTLRGGGVRARARVCVCVCVRAATMFRMLVFVSVYVPAKQLPCAS